VSAPAEAQRPPPTDSGMAHAASSSSLLFMSCPFQIPVRLTWTRSGSALAEMMKPNCLDQAR
jgi:hypothetical protein